MGVDGPPSHDATAVGQLLARLGEAQGPVTLVATQPQAVLDLLSPAPRDLAPVLRVAADRAGMGRVPFTADVGYDVMPLLESAAPGLRDERADNDEAAGIWRTCGGLVMALPAVDAANADERLAAVLKEAEGLVVVVEPDLVRTLLPAVQGRLRGVLVLGTAEAPAGVVADLPDRVVDCLHGHAASGLLADAAFQARDVAVEGHVRVGEQAVAAPCTLLAGAARRASGDVAASVVDASTADAIFCVNAARAAGALPSRCKVSVALHRPERPGVARALACAFLQANLGAVKPTPSSRTKVRIRG